MIVNLITPSAFLQMWLPNYTYYWVLKRWTTRWDLMWSRICLPFRNNWEHPVLLGFVMLSLYFSVVFSVLLFVCLSFFIYPLRCEFIFDLWVLNVPFGIFRFLSIILKGRTCISRISENKLSADTGSEYFKQEVAVSCLKFQRKELQTMYFFLIGARLVIFWNLYFC